LDQPERNRADSSPGGRKTPPLPEVLKTSVVGSYSVPEWLGRFKTARHRGRLSAAGLQEIEEVAIKAAVVDQTLAGIDIISDGELGRDNDMDYLLEVIAGLQVEGEPKHHYFDYLEAVVREPLQEADGLDDTKLIGDFRLVRQITEKTVTVSLAGPFSLARRVRNLAYPQERDLVLALARVLNRACRSLVDAGATHIQIDEPFLAGHPEMVTWAIDAVNTVVADVSAHVALHVCYGNRFSRPAWEGHYDFLFPAVCEARIDELVLEFARKGLDDLELVRRYPTSFEIGVGVIDVKSRDVEPVQVVKSRLYRALKMVPAERIVVNPDCGLRHLPIEVARCKLAAMSEAAEDVRADVLGTTRQQRPGVEDGITEQEDAPSTVDADSSIIADI
jgi:5-methyltetrahydropteroyltriglutamate--homocysteine methyltransferase